MKRNKKIELTNYTKSNIRQLIANQITRVTFEFCTKVIYTHIPLRNAAKKFVEISRSHMKINSLQSYDIRKL